MPVDYEKLNRERDWKDETIRANQRLADMYGDPAHFILELLQNAEDALKRRPASWKGSRSVSFNLLKSEIRVEHFGRPFNEKDVKGITVTLSSTKENDLTQIGKFGVGFKSVFNITDCPRIHSEGENFAIKDFILPFKINPLTNQKPQSTVFRLPLNENGKNNRPKLAANLENLESTTLLFLKQIEEITWRVSNGQNGKIKRETKPLDQDVHKITITRKSNIDLIESSEQWIVFSRTVTHGNKNAGNIEIAFRLSVKSDSDILPLTDSPLVVYFPTIVKTNLGFLIQGPYQTTLNRENVPPENSWNQKLMAETAILIPKTLSWLRDNGLLDAKVLNCFPIVKEQFGSDSFFNHLYEATKSALKSDALLPCTDGIHRRSDQVRLGNTDAVRQLFTPAQLAELYGQEGQLFWISDDITEDRTPELRRYIRDELGVADVTPERVVQLLRNNCPFLESQPNEWIRRLYEFFSERPALASNLKDIPLLRLNNKLHIKPNGEIQAFLPSEKPSQFPTLAKSVCDSEAALRFLKSLGLREPHPVDDVIINVLPKYQANEVDDSDYAADIQLIVDAHKVDEISRKIELVSALKKVKFVKTVAAVDGSKQFSNPSEIYLATAEQRKLFDKVKGVIFVDDSEEHLNNPDIHKVLQDCGAIPSANMSEIVMKHILPRYSLKPGQRLGVNDADYEADIKCILAAYENIQNEQRLTYINHLQNAAFVRAIDLGTNIKYWSKPGNVYLPTDLLKALFEGVSGVYMIDEAYDCLRDEAVVNLLVRCGVAPHLKDVSAKTTYSQEELNNIRRNNGLERASWSSEIQDKTLRGVENVLALIPTLDAEFRHRRAGLLWNALTDFAENATLQALQQAFKTTYKWGYSGESKAVAIDTAIVRKLNAVAWVPDSEGELQIPKQVDFETLRDGYGWEEEPTLTRIIQFKPPIIARLAREAGIDPAALDLMQKHGVTAEKLQELINSQLESQKDVPSDNNDKTHEDSFNKEAARPAPNNTNVASRPNSKPIANPSSRSIETGKPNGPDDTAIQNRQTSNRQHEFVSYIGIRPDSEELDPDGKEHSKRLSLEEKAIQFILECEPGWQRTPPNNPGFDLYKTDPNGNTVAYCEVKALSETLDNGPAAMTRTQFEKAQEQREHYWLYVVENAGADNQRIVKIQNPAGKGQTFTFDRGWRAVADPEVDPHTS